MTKDKENTELDELLRSMPKFYDIRSKEEVLHRLLQDLEADEKAKDVGKGMPRGTARWMPILVSIASVFLLAVLVPSFMDNAQQESSSDLVKDSPALENKEMQQDPSGESEISITSVPPEDQTKMMGFDETLNLYKLESSSAIYEEDLNGGTAFHFSFLENAMSVPVTIIIPQDQIVADFPSMEPSSLDLYNQYAGRIDEAALAFDDYHPYKGYFFAEGDTLVHHLPADHGYGMASGTTVPYLSSINEIFVDFAQLKRVNEDGTPIEWDQVGLLSEPTPLTGQYPRQAYYVYEATNGETYLAPTVNFYENAEQALFALNEPQGNLYSSPIPNDVTFQYTEQKTNGIITFDKPLDLSKMDEGEANRLIDALTLTAGSFGLNIKLENVVQTSWDQYDFTDVLPRPVGPNGYMMEN